MKAVGYSPSRDPSADWAVVFFGGHRTASSFQKYVCSVTPILLDRLNDGLALPYLHFDTLAALGDDLLGGFFLSAWHGMSSFGCDTDRFSLWKWCR